MSPLETLTAPYNTEVRYTPMTLLKLGRAALINAHPDDEAFTGNALLPNIRLLTPGKTSFAIAEPYVITLSRGEAGENRLDPTILGPALAARRTEELEQSLSALEIAHERQLLLSFPDGQLDKAKTDIARQLVDLARQHKFEAYIVPNRHAFDGHPDHEVPFKSARIAQQILAAEGIAISVIEQANDDSGVYEKQADEAQVLRAIRAHQSQIAFADGRPADPAFEVMYGRFFAYATYHLHPSPLRD